MRCPKCGSEQPQSEECRRCKVIISKYNTIQRRQTDKKKEINLRQEFAPGKKIDLKQEFMIPSNAPLSTAYAVRYQVRWVLEIQVLARKSFDFHAEFPIAVVN